MNKLKWFPDNPIKTSNEDKLSYNDSADLLTKIIIESEPPLSIGLYGEWGSGKTSLMKLIMEKLARTEIKVSWFDTWNYANEEEIWRILLISLIDDLAPNGDMSPDIKKIISSVLDLGFITSKAVLTHGANLYADRANIFEDILGLNSKKSRKESIIRDKVRTIKEFRKDFNELVNKSVGINGKLVVFIDDLDRIEPSKVIQTIEAIKIFLCCEMCIFVIGCDYNYLNNCIENRYEKMKIFGKDYIDKIIQVPFKISRMSDYQFNDFVRSHVSMILEDQAQIEQSVELITSSIDKNPRKVKGRINSFSLILQLNNDSIDEILLLKLLCFSEGWPDFYNQMVDTFHRGYNDFDKLDDWVFPTMSNEEFSEQQGLEENAEYTSDTNDEHIPDPYIDYVGQKETNSNEMDKVFERELNSEIEIRKANKQKLKNFLKLLPSISQVEHSKLAIHLAQIEKVNLDRKTAHKIPHIVLRGL